MPSIYYSRFRTGAFGKAILIETKNVTWVHSLRNARGELILRDNPFSRQNVRTIRYVPAPSNVSSVYYLAGQPPFSLEVRPEYKSAAARLEAESYARLRGRLYKGSAALGVTIGSWKQSREMIVTRYRQMSLQSDRFEVHARKVIHDAHIDRNTKRRNYNLKALADQYLELVFGWKPLLADIHAAATTVIHSQPQLQRVSATARTYVEFDWSVEDSLVKQKNRISGTMQHSRGVTVEITNPNKWLAERAGLNNGFAVAWDLIPFSFVVNMFVNTGSLVNSITDFAGLSFPSSVAVNSHDLTYDLTLSQKLSLKPPIGGFAAWQLTKKYQVLGGVGRPPLITKLPEVSWELAGIAASLFIQKFRVLQVLTGPLIKR